MKYAKKIRTQICLINEAYFKRKTIKSNSKNPSVRGSKGKIKVVGFVNRDSKKVKVFTNNISSLSDDVLLIKQTCVAENTHDA